MKILAEGSYGKVILAKKKEENQDGLPSLIAVKVFQMSIIDHTEMKNRAGAKDETMMGDEDQAGTSDE